MKRLLLFTFSFLVFFSSCENDADIGDLYGQWQITFVHTPEADYTPTDVYLAFQSDVVFARLTGTDDHYADRFVASFRHYGDSLSLSFYVEGESSEVIHSYLTDRFHFPGDHADLRFGIEQLNSSSLVLTQGTRRWCLRSF